MIDTIIIGAGAAGLMAARELKRAGKSVLILESSDRVGGRIMTVYDAGAGLPAELGAEFLHGDAPETTRLLDEAHLVTVPVLGEHVRSDDGELSPQGPIWIRMNRVFSHLNPDRKKDRSFQAFLDELPGGAALREERELARGFVQGFNGADTALISAKSLAEEGDPTEGAAAARRVVNGYSALIAFIRADVTNDIRLNCRVQRIALDEDRVRVNDVNGKEYEARSAILAVPLPALQDESIVIEPEVPEMRKAARKLVMGHVARVCIVVREAFWEKKKSNLSFVHSPERPFNVWWTQNPLHAPLIVGWSGGPPALEITQSGELEDIAMSELGRAFSMRRQRIEALIDSIHWHDWSRDRNVLGAYSYIGVGGTNAPRVVARAIHNKLFLAGEATDSGSGGTVEGALASGKRAAKKVLEKLSA